MTTLRLLLRIIMPVVSKLDKLLPVENLHTLYISLGQSLKTNIDVNNLNYDSLSINNSIKLLLNIGFISLRFGRYSKKIKVKNNSLVNFKKEILLRLIINYSKEFNDIFNNDLSYEEHSTLYFIKRNSIPLDLSGFLMLLSGLEIVLISNNNVYIKNIDFILDFHKVKLTNRRSMTIIELKNQLIIKDELGNEAELFALDLEKSILKKQQIDKIPQIISKFDVSAGYDIVSFLKNDSIVPDKFIEVKSCSDDKYKFYISKNEIKTARNKGDSYFLYLYNRKNNKFRIIKNPYERVINNNNWAKESEIIEVHSII